MMKSSETCFLLLKNQANLALQLKLSRSNSVDFGSKTDTVDGSRQLYSRLEVILVEIGTKIYFAQLKEQEEDIQSPEIAAKGFPEYVFNYIVKSQHDEDITVSFDSSGKLLDIAGKDDGAEYTVKQITFAEKKGDKEISVQAFLR